MKIAVLQEHAEVLDIEANLATLEAGLAKAAADGVDVLVTPELFVTGYAPGRLANADLTHLDDVDERLGRMAATHGVALVASAPMVAEDGRLAIGAWLFDKGGRIVLTYQKVHLFGQDERETFGPASRPPRVVHLDGRDVAVLICYDIEFPESVRAAADRGAEFVLVPTALTEGFDSVPQVLVRARALESQVTVAYANHVGVEDGLTFAGGSVIVTPDGEVAAQGDASAGLVVADVPDDAAEVARARVPYLAERRGGLYAQWREEGL